MAVLSREQYLSTIQQLVGDNTDDNVLNAVSDLSDTYEHFNSGVDWEQRYKDNDNAWRKKYRDRFFSGAAQADDVPPPVDTKRPLRFEELFKESD